MVKKRNEVYKCSVCGNIVSVDHMGGGQLVCCGKPMDLMVENSVDAAKEKHVPVIEIVGKTVKVTVGSVPHPMEPAHFIEFIQLLNKEGVVLGERQLKPGDRPEAVFCLDKIAGIYARELCNLHGLWKN